MKHSEKKLPEWVRIKIALLRQTIAIERERAEELEMIVNTYHFGVKR